MRSGRRNGILSLAFAGALTLLSITAIIVPNSKAFGDGLTMETFTATFGGRSANLLVTSKSSHTDGC